MAWYISSISGLAASMSRCRLVRRRFRAWSGTRLKKGAASGLRRGAHRCQERTTAGSTWAGRLRAVTNAPHAASRRRKWVTSHDSSGSTVDPPPHRWSGPRGPSGVRGGGGLGAGAPRPEGLVAGGDGHDGGPQDRLHLLGALHQAAADGGGQLAEGEPVGHKRHGHRRQDLHRIGPDPPGHLQGRAQALRIHEKKPENGDQSQVLGGFDQVPPGGEDPIDTEVVRQKAHAHLIFGQALDEIHMAEDQGARRAPSDRLRHVVDGAHQVEDHPEAGRLGLGHLGRFLHCGDETLGPDGREEVRLTAACPHLEPPIPRCPGPTKDKAPRAMRKPSGPGGTSPRLPSLGTLLVGRWTTTGRMASGGGASAASEAGAARCWANLSVIFIPLAGIRLLLDLRPTGPPHACHSTGATPSRARSSSRSWGAVEGRRSSTKKVSSASPSSRSISTPRMFTPCWPSTALTAASCPGRSMMRTTTVPWRLLTNRISIRLSQKRLTTTRAVVNRAPA